MCEEGRWGGREVGREGHRTILARDEAAKLLKVCQGFDAIGIGIWCRV